jgi:hypothetical protein
VAAPAVGRTLTARSKNSHALRRIRKTHAMLQAAENIVQWVRDRAAKAWDMLTHAVGSRSGRS